MEQYKEGKNRPSRGDENDGVRPYSKGRAPGKQGCSLADDGRCEHTSVRAAVETAQYAHFAASVLCGGRSLVVV